MKANINGTIQDYKPRPIPGDLYGGDIKTNGVIITPFDSKVLTAVAVIGENTDEAAFLDTDIYPVMGIDDTPKNREMVEASIRKLQKAGLLTVENVFSWGKAEDHAQDENESQLKDSVSYSMRKEMYGERALYEMLGVVAELFEEMAAFCECVHSDTKTARHFYETAENCEIVRDVIANRNSRKR